ncbi:protein kinase [Candidatus Dependentiae bacterium]|nr:protein kinase [Candidatus Dependentiae bacterium]
MNKEKNLLFGVLAVQMGFVTKEHMMAAAVIWATNQNRVLSDILVENGWLKEKNKLGIENIVELQLEDNENDLNKALDSIGGLEVVHKSFAGSIVVTESGEVLPSIGGTQEPTDTVSAQDDLTNDEKLTIEQPGRYTIKGEQGRGGIGKVLVAFDSHLGREIAVKELIAFDEGLNKDQPTPISKTAAMVARFLTEARITGQLEHPSIVPVYEIGKKSDGKIYYTMKLVKGETLADKLANEKDLAGRLKYLDNFVDLCNAIAYAHSRGVIHRDIKPQNVMIGEFGETVVLDWGLAKVKGHTDESSGKLKLEIEALKESSGFKTIPGRALGTPSYMPPEQAEGLLDEIDEQSDVYSLGAVLYEILTGQPPHTGETVYEIMSKVIDEEPKKLIDINKDLPADLVAICEKALYKKKKKRYANALNLSEDIKNFMTGSMVSAYQYNPIEKLKKWAKKNKPVVITATVGILLLFGLTLFTWINISKNKQFNKFSKVQILLEKAVLEEQKGNYYLSYFYYINAYLNSDENKIEEYSLEGISRLSNLYKTPKENIEKKEKLYSNKFYFQILYIDYKMVIKIFNSSTNQIMKNYKEAKEYGLSPNKKYLILHWQDQLIEINLEKGTINEQSSESQMHFSLITPIKNDFIFIKEFNKHNKKWKIIKFSIPGLKDKEIVFDDWAWREAGDIISMNSDGNLILSGRQRKITFFNLMSNQSYEILKDEDLIPRTFSFSNDDKYLYFLGNETFNIYSLSKKKIIKKLKVYRLEEYKVTSKYYLFYCFQEAAIMNKNTYEKILKIPGEKHIQLYQEEDLCVCYSGREFEIWDINLRKRIYSVHFLKSINNIKIIEDKEIVITFEDKSKIFFKNFIFEVENSGRSDIKTFAFNSDYSNVIWCDELGTIYYYNIIKNNLEFSIHNPGIHFVKSTISGNKKNAALLTRREARLTIFISEILIFDLEKREELYRFKIDEGAGGKYYNFKFFPQSNLLIYCIDNVTSLFDIKQKEIIATFEGRFFDKYSISPDETKLITYIPGKKLFIWNLKTKELESEESFNLERGESSNECFYAFFNSNNKLIAAILRKGFFELVDLSSGENIQKINIDLISKSVKHLYYIERLIKAFPEKNLILMNLFDKIIIFNYNTKKRSVISRRGDYFQRIVLDKENNILLSLSGKKILFYNLNILELDKNELKDYYNENFNFRLLEISYHPLNSIAFECYKKRRRLLFDSIKYPYFFIFNNKDKINKGIAPSKRTRALIKKIILASLVLFILLFVIFYNTGKVKSIYLNRILKFFEFILYIILINTTLFFIVKISLDAYYSTSFIIKIFGFSTSRYFMDNYLTLAINHQIVFALLLTIILFLPLLFIKIKEKNNVLSKYKLFSIWASSFLLITIIFTNKIRFFMNENGLMGKIITFKEFLFFFLLGVILILLIPEYIFRFKHSKKLEYIKNLCISLYSFTIALILNWTYLCFFTFVGSYFNIILRNLYLK